jgi:hypothetical protein
MTGRGSAGGSSGRVTIGAAAHGTPGRAPQIGGGDLLGIADRATLTDGTAAAVVASDATIEWWCPVAEGDPVLARLLDARGGAIRLGLTNADDQPAAAGLLTAGHQRRVGRQVITTITGGEAVVELRDDLTDGILVRLLTVLRGDATVGWTWAPRAAAGTVARAGLLHRRWAGGMSVGRATVRGRIDDGLDLPEGAAVTLPTGARAIMAVTMVGVDGLPLRTRTAMDLQADRMRARLDTAARQWEHEVADVDDDGPWHDRVMRALSQLRMSTAPSGGVRRALTTSMPRAIGNERNIDERFAWLDDAARLVRIWERLDRPDLADATRGWVADALDDIGEIPAPVRVADGSPPPGEREVDLDGWRGHHPVRFGTDAADRVDLGAIAAASLVLDAHRHPRQLRRVATWLADQVHDGRPRPDHGRWNQRGPTARHIASALSIDAALRAASSSLRRRNPLDLEAWGLLDTAAELRGWLAVAGVSGRGHGAHWQRTSTDGTTDAMLLRETAGPERVAPELPDDGEGDAVRRASATVDLTLQQLGEGFALHRHLAHVDDGLPPGQSPDLGSSFEVVTALAAVGRWDDAHARMDDLLGRTDRWLQLSATIDPRSADPAGNLADTPAAISLVEAVLALRSGPR